MPIVKNLTKLGASSRAVIIPKAWLDYYEEKTGEEINQVLIEVDGYLTIKPVIKEEV